MTHRCAAKAAKTALFSVAASSATATMLLLISMCFTLPFAAAPQNQAAITRLAS
jgi:hypothetical protein